MSKLEQLKSMTTVVADTGDLEAIKTYAPEDATTNPSLVLKALQSGKYDDLLANVKSKHQNVSDRATALITGIGSQILDIIPGKVSTEVDARLSFDTQATIKQAHTIIDQYQDLGIDPKRVMIKIASTWQGIEAARQLEKEGIQCNLTLLFNQSQAMACADAGVTLISPFVGRIMDWYANANNCQYPDPLKDPGVISVTNIYNHYKKHQYKTVVMGASFRNQGQIEALAGCDKLTISPGLLESLSNDEGLLDQQLILPTQTEQKPNPISVTQFDLDLCQDEMACEKLNQGIRAFIADQALFEQQFCKI